MDMNTAEQLLARIQSQNVSRPGQETRAGRIMSKNYRQWCWEHQALKWWPRMIIYNVPIVRWTIVNVMRMNSSFPISSFKTSVVPSHGFLAFSLSRLKRSRSLGFRLLQTLGYRFWWELALWHFLRPGCKLGGILIMNWSTASNCGWHLETLIHYVCEKGPTSSSIADSIAAKAIIAATLHTLGDLLDGQWSIIYYYLDRRVSEKEHSITQVSKLKISKIPLYFSMRAASRYEGPIGSTEVWRTTSCSHFWYLS